MSYKLEIARKKSFERLRILSYKLGNVRKSICEI